MIRGSPVYTGLNFQGGGGLRKKFRRLRSPILAAGFHIITIIDSSTLIMTIITSTFSLLSILYKLSGFSFNFKYFFGTIIYFLHDLISPLSNILNS